MTRVEMPKELQEEDDYIYSMWKKLGRPSMQSVIDEYASDAFKEWRNQVVAIYENADINHTM